MENIINIKEHLQTLQNENIITQQRKSGLTPLCILMAGAICMVINLLKISNNDKVQILLCLIGITGIITGLILLISACKKENGVYVYVPWNCKLKKHYIYFDSSQKQHLHTCVNNRQWLKLQNIAKNNGNAVCLRAYECTCKDRAMVIMQLSEYVPHQFTDTTPVITLEDEEARAVIQFLNQ